MSPSSRDLLIANALTGGAALVFDWPLAWLLWPYWLQSAIIGWYARQRMLALREFSTEDFTSKMFLPYLRIVPMHATIILSAGAGASAGWPVLLFVGLKTAADLTLDTVDRRLAGKVASKARVAR